MFSDPISLVFFIIILLFSAVLHEVAHGYVADRLGDPTARLLGRLTLNPIRHIDLYMTIILPLLLLSMSHGTFVIGGAKPVPVDPFNLKDGRKDLALVSLAGPLTNVLIAIAASVLFHILPIGGLIAVFLQIAVFVNVMLAIFNLMPIPPLDGSKVFSLILPEDMARAYMSIGGIMGFVILIAVLQFTPLNLIIANLYTGVLHLLGF